MSVSDRYRFNIRVHVDRFIGTFSDKGLHSAAHTESADLHGVRILQSG